MVALGLGLKYNLGHLKLIEFILQLSKKKVRGTFINWDLGPYLSNLMKYK